MIERIALTIGLTAGVLLAAPTSAHLAGQENTYARVDELFRPWARPDTPGCAVGIVRNGALVLARGYGMADLEHDVHLTPSSALYVGSLSKQFTAMAIALLVRKGALGLDDDIRTYLPELPEYSTPVRVQHLIHHTSGLPDYLPLVRRAGWRPDAPFGNRDVLDLISRERQLDFRPGERFVYSNTGYTLLASIVERAAGMPLDEFARAEMFEPLGMTATHFHADATTIVPQRAYAYEPRAGGGFRLAPSVPARVGAGGIFTTIEDLARWDRNFYEGRVGGAALIEQITTPGRNNDGQSVRYGFGLEIAERRGLRVVEHGGDLVGYHAYLTRVPARRLSVICLCNLSTIDAGPLAHAVLDMFLDGP